MSRRAQTGCLRCTRAGGSPSIERTDPMSLFMDVHHVDRPVSLDAVAKARTADLQTQEKYGVRFLRYWVDEAGGTIFCLVDAPDAESALSVHREAHGLVADQIYRVAEGA